MADVTYDVCSIYPFNQAIPFRVEFQKYMRMRVVYMYVHVHHTHMHVIHYMYISVCTCTLYVQNDLAASLISSCKNVIAV